MRLTNLTVTLAAMAFVAWMVMAAPRSNGVAYQAVSTPPSAAR